MNYDESITTAAPAARAWAAISDVTDWPNWTPSMTEIIPLDGPGLAVGRRFRVRQPGLPSLVWRVVEVTEGESFSWEASSPGVRTVGFHRLDPAGAGIRISIGIHQTGPVAGLVHLFLAAKTRRYLKLESAGLKAAAESPIAPATTEASTAPATTEALTAPAATEALTAPAATEASAAPAAGDGARPGGA